jgi:O-antigen ligase
MSMKASRSRHASDAPGTAAFILVACIVLLAPLFRGGNRPLPLLILELIAVAGLAVALVPAQARQRIPVAAAIVAGVVALIPLLQLIPLPLDVWGGIAGRAPFVEALRDVAGVTTHAISVIPFETEYAALALLPPLAAYFLGFQLRQPQVIRLLQLLVAVAVVEATIGLIQYGLLGGGAAGTRASGTFVNPNHYAGLLVMVLPIALMGLAVEIGDRTHERIRGRGLFGALKRAVASKGLNVMISVAVIVLLLMAIVFSRSRMGIALAALGIAVTTITAAPRIGGPAAYGMVGLVLAVVVGLAAAIGLLPVIDRYAGLDVFEDGRWTMIMAAIEMAGRYFPVGAGVGTFAGLYPPFQPPELLSLIHRAHNDYVEWVVEGGLLALLAIALAAMMYVARLVMLAREKDKHRVHYLQIGAAIGLLLMALHGLVDFNLRIPANAIIFALLGGLLLSRHQAAQLQEHRRDRRGHVATAPIPVAPLPHLDAEAAARVHAVWAAPVAAAGPVPASAPAKPTIVPDRKVSLAPPPAPDSQGTAEAPIAPAQKAPHG